MRNLPFLEEILANLRRFKECVEDNNDVNLERPRFDLLVQLGLLERVQRSPARWMMTQAGEDAIAQPAAGEPQAKPIAYVNYAANGQPYLDWLPGGEDESHALFGAPPSAAHGDEAVRKDATESAIQRACDVLPEDWTMQIDLERGAGCVTLFNPWGGVVDFGKDFESIGAEVEAAIAATMRAQAGEGGEV